MGVFLAIIAISVGLTYYNHESFNPVELDDRSYVKQYRVLEASGPEVSDEQILQKREQERARLEKFRKTNEMLDSAKKSLGIPLETYITADAPFEYSNFYQRYHNEGISAEVFLKERYKEYLYGESLTTKHRKMMKPEEPYDF